MAAPAERGIVLPRQELAKKAGETIVIFLPQSAGEVALRIQPSHNGNVRGDRWRVVGEPDGRGLRRSALDARFHPVTPVLKHGEKGRTIPKSDRNLQMILKRKGK